MLFNAFKNALGWETLETQQAKTKAKQMYKVLNGLAPSCLSDLFSSKTNITDYNLRGSSSYLTTVASTKNRKS
jgi:hypothetical protein